MDITVNKSRCFSNKYINAETVHYTMAYAASLFILIAVKQLLKTFFGLSAAVSCGAGFIIAEAVLYLLERFFVYKGNITASFFRQILFSVLNGAMHFALYRLVSVLFSRFDFFYYTIWFILAAVLFIVNYAISRILIFNCEKNADGFKSGKIYNRVFSNRFILLSMALSLAAMGFIFLVYRVFPFGDTTVLRMDLYHQYGPLFVELFDRVADRETFIYSWISGGGSSFLGNYFNYLSSPLNLLIFLFDRNQMPFAISFLVALKCMLASGTFTLYIKKSFNRHSFASAAFGMLYAFSAYMLAYFWNIMWLDGMFMLPLILLGIENIINSGKCRLYVLSLIYMLYASYYIGYMLCIFSVIYFLAYFLLSYNRKQKDSCVVLAKKFSFKNIWNNRVINRTLKFAAASAFAGAVCAFFLIPVYYILSGCSATSDSMPSEIKDYFTVLDFIQNHFAGLETTIRSSGDDVIPNIYSGVFALILVPLFVVNKKISLKEKAVYLSLLLILFVSFNTNYLNFIWHAFHFPNDLPYRFSFIYSFILLVVSFKSLMHIKGIGIKEIGFTAMAWLAFLAISQETGTNKMTDFTIYATIAFIIVWTVVLFMIKQKKLGKFVMGVLVIAVTFCEIIISDINAFNFNQSLSNYNENYNTYTEAVDYIEENDTSFYRTELCHLNTRMDPCLYGYRGISAFSSMAYENYSRLQHNIGMYGNRINSYTYNLQTPVYNLMYSVKYLIYNGEDVKPSTDLYTRAYSTENYGCTVYENDYFLPVSYCVNSSVDIWETGEGNPFQIQNDFFALATGFSDVFTPAEYISGRYDGISGEQPFENGAYTVSKSSETGTAEISLKASQNGNFYLFVSSSDISNITCRYGESTVTQNIETPYILDLGFFEKGSNITVSIDANAMKNNSANYEIYAYSLNKPVLEAGYEKLLAHSLEVTELTGTKIKGNIHSDESCILYSSIPYDKGWSIYIDGERQETFEIAKSQLGVMIKAGQHTIEYSYRPQGLGAGIIISISAVLLFSGYILLKKRARKRSSDYVPDNIDKEMTI